MLISDCRSCRLMRITNGDELRTVDLPQEFGVDSAQMPCANDGET